MRPEGIEVRDEDVYEAEGEKSETFVERLFQRSFQRLPTSEEMHRCLANKEKAFAKNFVARPFPGLLELLAEIRALPLGRALVSGSRKIQERYAALPSLLETFPVIVGGDEVRRGKPDPEPFLLAAEKLGASPSECLVLENAPLGIRAARAAGMTCWGVRNNSPLSESELLSLGASRVIQRIADLPLSEILRFE